METTIIMKPQPSKKKVGKLKKLLALSLASAIPLTASAQGNYLTVLMNFLMNPNYMAQQIQQDPAFVPWQGNTYLQPIDPATVAAVAEGSLPLDEETAVTFTDTLGNVILLTNTLFDALVASGARKVGTAPYQLDFGGAQRDSVASAVSVGKAAVAAQIAVSTPYVTTKTGKVVLPLSAATLTLVSDVARYAMQEYLKAYLINKNGFTTNAGAWAAFAAAQAFGFAMVPAWGYAVNLSLAPHFNATSTSRRQLLQNISTDVKNYTTAQENSVMWHNAYENSLFDGQPNHLYQQLAAQQSALAGSYYNSYKNDTTSLTPYYDLVFQDLNVANSDLILSETADPFPGYTNQPTTAPDYSLMFDSVYDGYISRCTASSDGATQTVSVICPLTKSYWREEVRLAPTKQDANGNVTVYRNYVRPDGSKTAASSFVINAKNIDTANYH